jgi:hypothetical protein
MKFIVLLFSFSIFLISFCTRIDELQYGEKQQITIHKANFYQTSPSTVLLKSGEWMVVYSKKEDDISSGGRIFLVSSNDYGKTWTSPDTIVNTTWHCQTPSIMQLRDGLIIMNFGSYQNSDKKSDIRSSNCFIVRSFDNGKTFNAPRMIPVPGYDYIFTNSKILELKNGTLLLPVHGRKKNRQTNEIFAIISYDRGESFKDVTTIASDLHGQITFRNPSLIQLPQGKLLCMLETDKGDDLLYQTFSHDKGETWSIPISSGIIGRSPDLLLTSNGAIICSFRDYWPNGISVVVSYDQGFTWEEEIPILEFDSKDELLPSLMNLNDDLFAVCYSIEKSNKWDKGLFATVFKWPIINKPCGFSVSISGHNQVNLRWNAVKRAYYYLIYRDTISDFLPRSGYPFKGNAIASTTSNQFTDIQIDSGIVYYYRISAVAGSGKLIPNSGSESEPSIAIGVEKK